MRTNLPTHACAASAILCACLAHPGCERPSSQPAAPSSAASTADYNAADEYRSLYDAMSEELLTQSGNAQENPGPAVIAALTDAKPIIDRLVWAANLDRCDWGIDDSAGLDTELPHLGKVRALTRLLRADAFRALQQGDSATAANDVAAIINLSVHVGGRSAIEVMTAGAVLMVGAKLTTDHTGDWTDADRATLRNALAKLDPDDPFDSETALAQDRKLSAAAGVEPIDENMYRQAVQKVAAELRAALTAVK